MVLVAQRPPFDLAAQIDSVDPTTVGAGDPISVGYTLTGENQLSGTFERSFYLSTNATITTGDLLINTRIVDLLEGNRTLTSLNNFIPRTAAPGAYFVGMIVESGGDTNPANNTSAGLAVTVTANRAPFDIAVAAISVNPTTVAAGAPIQVEYNVTNTSQTSGSYFRDLYISADNLITTGDTLVNRRTINLNGDDAGFISSNNVVPAVLAPGAYFVGVILETDGDTSPGDNASNGLPLTVIQAVALSAGQSDPGASSQDVERGNPAADGSEPSLASEQAN